MTETRRVSDLVETVRTELIAAKIERRVSQLRVLATASALAFWAPNGTCWVPNLDFSNPGSASGLRI
jgi:hypothetical protein